MSDAAGFVRAAIAVIWVALSACREQEALHPPRLSPLAQEGKAVFEARRCGKCHYLGDEAVASEAPSLLDPFLANDSLFVETHLRFVQQTKMPPVELTPREIKAVSHYVAELHRARYPSVPPEQADALCPVCYAPVSSRLARKQRLVVRYLDEPFFFECDTCLETFKKAPTAFRELLRQYQAGSTAMRSDR